MKFVSEHKGIITGQNDTKHECVVCKSITETKDHATYFQMSLVTTYLPIFVKNGKVILSCIFKAA